MFVLPAGSSEFGSCGDSIFAVAQIIEKLEVKLSKTTAPACQGEFYPVKIETADKKGFAGRIFVGDLKFGVKTFAWGKAEPKRSLLRQALFPAQRNHFIKSGVNSFMQRTLAAFLFLLTAAVIFGIGQTANPKDEYSAGREVITDLGKIVNPQGIQENFKVPLGGVNQWVYAREQNRANPIILFVHGGPASPSAPVAWAWQRSFEEYFTVVNYDQRLSGKSFTESDSETIRKDLKIERYVDDAVQLAEHLVKRYAKNKIILVGHSWGTIIGVRAALKRPDLFYAYVGIGQVVNTVDNERLSYQYAVDQAAKSGNEAAVKELKSIYPYPGNAPLTRERIIIARKWAQFYGGLSAYRSESKYYFYAPLLSPEYDAADVEAIDQGNQASLGRLLPEFLTVDFKKIKTFPIPIFMLLGRHDYTTPSKPTADWLQSLKAPVKKSVWFENSAHLLMLEEPGKTLLTLVESVRPIAIEK